MTSKYALDREDLTLNARLVRGLREAILSGDLKGGARLVEREMTEMFGVSRGLLREAIQTLASEGLITLVPHKGPVVTLLGREEAAQLYHVLVIGNLNCVPAVGLVIVALSLRLWLGVIWFIGAVLRTIKSLPTA